MSDLVRLYEVEFSREAASRRETGSPVTESMVREILGIPAPQTVRSRVRGMLRRALWRG
jgi:hypothetical protein